MAAPSTQYATAGVLADAVTVKPIFDFTDASGGQPSGGVSGAGDGKLLGSNFGGGSAHLGTIYEIDPSGSGYSLGRVHAFAGGADDGAFPGSGPVRGSEGDFFGTASEGGGTCPDGCGVVYALRSAGVGWNFRVVYRFLGGSDGVAPFSSLVEGPNGVFFGTTAKGGQTTSLCYAGCGTVFKLVPSTDGAYVETVLYRFQNGVDGTFPTMPLAIGADGTLFGTAAGGSTGDGVIFSLTPSFNGYTEQTIYTFTGARDGAMPSSGLVSGRAGDGLFGTTSGYSDCCGTIYRLVADRNGRYRVDTLYRFRGGREGAQPTGLTFGHDRFFGETTFGGGGCGSVGCGTVFSLIHRDGEWREQTLYSFGNLNFSDPVGTPFLGKGGALFGVVSFDANSNGGGGIFELIP
jgi:hypothetical protein